MEACGDMHRSAVIAGEYVCDICYQSFKEEILLNEHSLVHNDETLIFNYWEKIQKNPLNHVDMVDASFETLYTSDACQKGSKKKSKLSKQKSTLVDTHSDKQHICDICKKVFKKKCHLDDHHFTHTSEKPYVCEFCQKGFSRKRKLAKHVEAHFSDKAHICHICQKSFVQRQYLLTHILIHGPVEKKSHICDVCQKVFAQKSNLMRHRILHTGKKPHVCDVCNKSFPRRSQLVSHQVVHSSGEKQYVCEICQKQFLRKAHYARHKVLHSGIKPHKCNICQKGFSRKCHLETHRLNICLKQMKSAVKVDVSETPVCLNKEIDQSLQATPQHDSQITETEVQLNNIDASGSSKPTDKTLSNILIKNELDTDSETTDLYTEATESTEGLKIKVEL